MANIGSEAIQAVKEVPGKVKSSGVGLGGLLGVGMTAWMGISEYNDAREKGDSKLTAVTKAVATTAWYDMIGLWAIPLDLAGAGIQIGMASGEVNTKTMLETYNQRGRFGSGHVDLTEAGYTMRQRSLNAIRQNGLNLQSALGNEARQYYGKY